MRPPTWAAHLAAAGLAVAGVVAQVSRPLAPNLDPLPDPSRWFEPQHLALVAEYREPLYAAALLAFVLRVAVPCLIAFTRVGRRLVGSVVDRVGEQRPARAAAAVVVAVVVLTDLVVLPLSFWAGYVHEGAFGFRVQGLDGWAADWLMAKAPFWLGAAVLALVAWWLAGRLPRVWPAVGAYGAVVATAALVMAAPLILEPLTFRTEPLPAGPVRDEVERVLERSGETIEQILVADASRRTTKHNAYVSGLGRTRRVVLYDTLVEGQPADEVAMVLAHEIGHHRNADHLRGVAFAGAGMVVLAYGLWWLVGWRTAAGRQRRPTDPRAAAVVLAAVIVLNAASYPVQNLASRRAEAAADLAALDITQDPETYLRMTERLSRANLGHPAPPRWVVLLWASHPPAAARLQMGERWPFDEEADP